MKTQLKTKTVSVKEVTKSSPPTSTNPRTSNDGANRTTSHELKYTLAPGDFEGVQVAKLKNQ